MSEPDVSLPQGPAIRGGDERRAAARRPCEWHGPTRLIVRHDQAAHWARPHDVSAAGIGLLLAHPLETGGALTIHLRERLERPAAPLSATIVHAGVGPDGVWLIGCAFDRMLTAEEMEQFL
jgi:hypothetical protein